MSSVGFEEAVGTLKGMFVHIDTDVIAAVLESCGLRMEIAIEQLLALDPSNAGGAPAEAMDGPAPPTPAPATTVGSLPGGADVGPGGLRHPLPADFLAVPGGVTGSTTSTDQMLQDEAIAQMMSDEMFMEQLRSDPEFAAYLGAEAAYLDEINRESVDGPAPGLDDGRPKKSFKEKLSKMGTGMKARFASMASRFKKNKSGSATPRGTGAEYTSLLDTTDDDGITTLNLDVTSSSRDPGAPFAIGDDSDDEGTLTRRPAGTAH